MKECYWYSPLGPQEKTEAESISSFAPNYSATMLDALLSRNTWTPNPVFLHYSRCHLKNYSIPGFWEINLVLGAELHSVTDKTHSRSLPSWQFTAQMSGKKHFLPTAFLPPRQPLLTFKSGCQFLLQHLGLGLGEEGTLVLMAMTAKLLTSLLRGSRHTDYSQGVRKIKTPLVVIIPLTWS